ncbi:MAG: ATP-binding protein [Firmicutes bacterium]|nr:ATP-binding protein [Bacillota bacterium]
MKLVRFRIKDFRSVVDTGWISCQNVTAFAGENESGKTTMLMALLKLTNVGHKDTDTTVFKSNEVEMAQIDLANDVPIDRYEELAPNLAETEFIFAEFAVDEEMNNDLKFMLPGFTGAKTITISRKYSGEYTVDILKDFPKKEAAITKGYIVNKIPKFMYYKEVHEVDSEIDFLSLALKLNGNVHDRALTAKETIVSNLLDCLDIWESNLIKSIVQIHEKLSLENLDDVDFRMIFEQIPYFRARVERGFNLLTKEFQKWWGKDDTIITFEPYSRGVVINIIDENGRVYKLENRSTGFRRFFALFLSFSITGRHEYENSILLFDEAGAALHPLVQRKLADFFDHLGKRKQLLYNTHTAYMLNVGDLNRVRVIYKDGTKHTRVSETLKINPDRSNEMSLFPVQSSLAMYVAEKAMAGCFPVVVMNEYDEYYLSIIKNILAAKGKLNTVHNILIFATGENGIDAASEAFSSDEDYPVILLPSDNDSRRVKERLVAGKYKDHRDKILELSDFIEGAVKFEDLIPDNFVEIFSRVYLQNILDKDFVYDKKQDLILQIENYAFSKGITLPVKYRSELAKRMKIQTMMHFRDVNIPGKYVTNWLKIWRALLK